MPPCNFLFKAEIISVKVTLKDKRPNDGNTLLQALSNKPNVNIKQVKCKLSNTVTALNSKMQEQVLGKMYFEVQKENQAYLDLKV